MALRLTYKLHDIDKNIYFVNNKDFLLYTEGNGIKCKPCNSKIFYGFNNWKSHCKTKKHLKNFASLPIEDNEIAKLKNELKLQKAMTCKYVNLYESNKNKFKEFREKTLKELYELKKEIKKKFGIG
jgi:DNA-directed RNA polymerase subunit RPC12/RpoP